jgi:hypothetical protein
MPLSAILGGIADMRIRSDCVLDILLIVSAMAEVFRASISR